MSGTPSTPPGDLIAVVSLRLYRVDGVIRWVVETFVRGDDPHAEDPNLRQALIEAASDFVGRRDN